MGRYTESSTYSVSWNLPTKRKTVTKPKDTRHVSERYPETYKQLLDSPHAATAVALLDITDLPIGLVDDVAKVFHYAEDALDHFREMTLEQRTRFLYAVDSDRFDSWALCIYFRARKAAGNPYPTFRTLHCGDFHAIEESVRVAGGNPERGTYDFDSYALKLCERERKGMVHLTCLQLLRCVYGEDRVYEMLHHFDSQGVKWSNFDYVDILKNWEEMKNIPAHWIAEMLDSVNDSPRSSE